MERFADLRAAMPWLAAASIYVLVIAVAPQLLNDPDTYSHLALGRWILEHGTVPAVDPFSANFRGTHWLAFEWLSEVVFALGPADLSVPDGIAEWAEETPTGSSNFAPVKSS